MAHRASAPSWSVPTPAAAPTSPESTGTARRIGIASIRRELPADATQQQVEDVIDEHPDVELSGVVGVPDERLGAIVHAFVEFKPGRAHPPTADELAAFARQHLAAYKVPDRWTFVDALPRNAVGKIDRHALHEQATELDRA